MKDVQLIQNAAGHLTGIKLEIQDDPEMAKEIYHLLRALSKSKEEENTDSQMIESSLAMRNTEKAMSLTAFNKLIRTAKASGEITQEEFFQLHPTWQRDEKLSLPN